jgi:meso-butanediol dehydrogenase / (S,S)-butanediol dehydrogenase / diacetyl reductase
MAKVIVITGTGSGLGRALARKFGADGDKIVLLGRAFSKFESVARPIPITLFIRRPMAASR